VNTGHSLTTVFFSRYVPRVSVWTAPTNTAVHDDTRFGHPCSPRELWYCVPSQSLTAVSQKRGVHISHTYNMPTIHSFAIAVCCPTLRDVDSDELHRLTATARRQNNWFAACFESELTRFSQAALFVI